MAGQKTAVVKVPDSWAKLDTIIEQSSISRLEKHGRVSRAHALARAVQRLRGAITPAEMADFMALQGSPLGFLTDKDQEGGYDPPTVKECLIEALLRGVYPVGNEFNIIAGHAYITKAGMARLVRQFPGLTDLKINFGVPVMKHGGALVEASARWLLNGNAQQIERTIPVRVNRYMGVDAILGKAERKLLAAVYGRLTGSEHTVPDGEIDDLELQPAREGMAAKLTPGRHKLQVEAETEPKSAAENTVESETKSEETEIPAPPRPEQETEPTAAPAAGSSNPLARKEVPDTAPESEAKHPPNAGAAEPCAAFAVSLGQGRAVQEAFRALGIADMESLRQTLRDNPWGLKQRPGIGTGKMARLKQMAGLTPGERSAAVEPTPDEEETQDYEPESENEDIREPDQRRALILSNLSAFVTPYETAAAEFGLTDTEIDDMTAEQQAAMISRVLELIGETREKQSA